jgi:hypothetical protein
MISWVAVGLGLGVQLVVQVALFLGVPLLGPAALLDWTALLTWLVGPLAGGFACGLVSRGYAWICGLFVGLVGTSLFVTAVLLRADWWLIAAAVMGGGLFASIAALLGRGLAMLWRSR